MRRILFSILASAAISIINACGFNPFFPNITAPPFTASSPERTIQLLREAYEQKDIDAFVRLIYSTADYASYTQFSTYATGLLNLSSLPIVQIDSIVAPFTSSFFWQQNRVFHEMQWTHEHRVHRNMFNLSDEIVFLSPFFALETHFETDGSDTLSALVRTSSSQIRIKYGGEEFTIDVNDQIFIMARAGGVWKIRKWIELNNN